MKILRTAVVFLLILSMLIPFTACLDNGDDTTQDETTASETEETTEEMLVPHQTVTVKNPDWGYKAYSVGSSDGRIVSAELDFTSGNVDITSYNPGQAEVYVYDCFGHKAIIEVSVSDDEECSIAYKANSCVEEYIDAADFGVLPGKRNSALPNYAYKLQKAIDHAYSQGGGTVYLYPGIYSVSFIRMRDNVTLKMYSGFTDATEGFTDKLADMAKNGEITVLLGTRIMNNELNDYGRNGSKNFTISGGLIDNEHSTQSTLLFGLSENIVIENMIFKDMKNNHVIQITGTNNVEVRNCIFAGFEWGGTFTRESIQIEASTPGAHGSNVSTTPQRFDNGELYCPKNVVIDHCYFGPSDELPGPHIAIGHHGYSYEANCDGFRITNNIFDGCTYAAIRFANLDDVEITGNKFTASKDTNKFCDESDPAFIILFSYSSNVTYENIVDGRTVTKALAQETSGTHNVNISNNEFAVTKGSDKRIITVSGTTFMPGVIYKENVLRQNTYNSKPYLLSGYFKSTNYIGNLNFSDNKIVYDGQPAVKDHIFGFSNIYGFTFLNNDISLNGCTFTSKSDDVAGLKTSACYTGLRAETYAVQTKECSNYIEITHADGTKAKLKFSSSITSTLFADGGGRIELTSDNAGNVYVHVIPNEGYTFGGWIDSSSKLYTKTGNVEVTSKLSLTATFIKN